MRGSPRYRYTADRPAMCSPARSPVTAVLLSPPTYPTRSPPSSPPVVEPAA